ncbi:MAG: T9SS type A sorting domain-containing protein [Bacteroidales bacterium]|nr:T9SS type A sorting domain-containing protein [Bacteroidales bacterium]
MQTEETIANFNNAVYYAALREDTIAERIYCIQKEDGIERLIADYSLSPNDTISVFSFWPNINSPLKMTIEINSVDSILIGEIYHKRLSIDHDWASSEDIHESWIEGIGSSYGIFFPSSILNSLEVDYPRLLCVHINDTLYYQNEKYNNCYKDFSTQINSKNLNTNFNIHIENNKIVVDEGFEDFEYKIFDISGNILNIGIVYSNKIEISSLLNSGVYFLSLYENEGFNAFTSKFIIP